LIYVSLTHCTKGILVCLRMFIFYALFSYIKSNKRRLQLRASGVWHWLTLRPFVIRGLSLGREFKIPSLSLPSALLSTGWFQGHIAIIP